MSQPIPVQNRTTDELIAMSQPGQATVNGVRMPLFDTQLATGAASQVLTYFQAQNNDKTLSNVKGQGGQMPNNYYFEPLWINADFLSRATLAGGSTQVGIVDDIQQILFVGRALLILKLGPVTFPEIPLTYCHGSGGAIGSIGATLTAPNAVQFGNNGAQDSGYFIGNSFVLSPMVPFTAQLQFSSTALTLSASVNIRISFDGNWYQPVM